MKTKTALFAGCCTLLVSLAFAQPAPDTLWTQLYDFYPDYYVPPEGYALCETADGGFLLATGITENPFWFNVFAIRMDANGDTLWTHVYDYGLPTSVQQLPDGGFLISAGGSWDIMFSGRAFLIRTDANGDTVRTRRFTNAYNIASFLTTTGDEMMVGGNDTTRGEAFWLAKLNDQWESVWSHSYRRWDDWCVGMGRGRDGGFVLAGTYRISDYACLRIVFTDSAGTLRADSLYGPAYTFGLSAGFTEDGGCVMSAGAPTDSFGAYGVDEFARTEWYREYHLNGTRQASYAIASAANHGWILAGNVYVGDSANGETHMALARIDSSGEQLWSRVFGTGRGYSVISTRDGGFLMAGPWGGGYAITIVRTQPDGEGIGERPPVLPEEFTLTAYPNPFNPSTTLSFELPHASTVRLVVFDVLGREVYSRDFGRMEAGKHRHDLNGSTFASGLYLARLQAGSITKMQKLVLLK